jgi:hypothetical protein
MSSAAEPQDTIVTIDRFEGEWAVLEAPDGVTFEVPRGLLPPDAREGQVYSLILRLRPHIEEERLRRAAEIQRRLLQRRRD